MNIILMTFLLLVAFIAGYWVCLTATWNRVHRQEANIRRLSSDIEILMEMDDEVPAEWVRAELQRMVAKDFQ